MALTRHRTPSCPLAMPREPAHIPVMRRTAIVGIFLSVAGSCDSRESGKGDRGGPAAPATRDFAAQDQRPRVPIRNPLLAPAEVEAATQAWQTFLSLCGGPSALPWGEFESISIDVEQASGYQRADLDWETIAVVAIVFKDGVSRERSGQHIRFTMGAGKRPGIVATKAAGVNLCGFAGVATGVTTGRPCEPSGGEDCIFDTPKLAFLDRDRPSGVVVSDRAAPPAWCFAKGLDPPAFWMCSTDARQCKKARSAAKKDENGDFRVRSECERADAAHCFRAGDKSVCAPNAESCLASRKEWTTYNTVTNCEVATAAELAESQRD